MDQANFGYILMRNSGGSSGKDDKEKRDIEVNDVEGE